MVFAGMLGEKLTSDPAAAVLVVEVAESSLRMDRSKRITYARSGLADYWIFNLEDRSLEVCREPTMVSGEPV